MGSTPTISQDDRQILLLTVTIAMKTLLVVVVAVAVAVANARSIHKEISHDHDEKERPAARICTVTAIHTVFENGQLVTMKETHENELCPGQEEEHEEEEYYDEEYEYGYIG